MFFSQSRQNRKIGCFQKKNFFIQGFVYKAVRQLLVGRSREHHFCIKMCLEVICNFWSLLDQMIGVVEEPVAA